MDEPNVPCILMGPVTVRSLLTVFQSLQMPMLLASDLTGFNDGINMKNLSTINVLYDGSSPFWSQITRLVKRFDRGQYIHLTNIADRKFEARIYDKSQSELTADLHVQLSDGTWLKGSDAFRELFSKSRLRLLVQFSGLPLIRQLSNSGYGILMYSLAKMYRPDRQQSDTPASVLRTFSSGSAIRH